MTKIKVSELSGPALDWAVAKADGLEVYPDEDVWRCNISPSNAFHTIGRVRTDREGYSPSTDWSQGGALIEAWDIQLSSTDDEPGYESRWQARSGIYASGPTPLVAAMRAIVSAKLGDTVDVPEELLGAA